jgi:hypothetical protein
MKNYIGKQITIPAGARVRVLGQTKIRKTESIVTIRDQEVARNGKIRVFWKSHGYKASTLI